MTRFDIRIRRRALTRGQIERHKDFRGIKAVAQRSGQSGSLMKLVIIIVSIMLFLGMIIFGISKINTQKDNKKIQSSTTVQVDQKS